MYIGNHLYFNKLNALSQVIENVMETVFVEVSSSKKKKKLLLDAFTEHLVLIYNYLMTNLKIFLQIYVRKIIPSF